MAYNDNWQSGKTLSQSASFMLDNEIGTDITFKFPNTDETIKAHRFVLMARSHVFYVMFNSSLDKPGKDIEISDIEPVIFKEFIKYLYTDETTLSVQKALHLTYCAEKYEVTDLKAKCMDFLLSHVDETTVAVVLDHAVLYNGTDLISTCQDIIEPLETLSCLEECHITKDTMELVLGFERLVVGEVDIFKYCNTWAENECKRMEIQVNGSNKRKTLGPLLRRIPFCSMTHKQFATEVSGKHLLNGQEELQIFRFICAPDGSNPPFPCKTAKPVITIKLSNVLSHTWSTSEFLLYICCSRSYTLLGLGFTQAGNYTIRFDGNDEHFSIEEDDQQGFLKTPVKYSKGRCQSIESIPPVSSPTMDPQHSFTHVEQVEGQAGPIQLHLDFNIDSDGQPPFDTLIVQV